ncbi:MAG: DUF3298 and DUF4163 domain-containing protein [Ignavibacteriaceae bacterium]
MKNTLLFILTISLVLILPEISACAVSKSNPGRDGSEKKFITVTKDSLFIISENEECYVKIYYPVLNTEKPDEIIDSLNSFLKTEFTSLPEFYDINNCGPDYHFTYEASFEVKYADDKYLSIVFSFYEYSGGAHGNFASTAYNLDLKTGKRLMLGDIIRDNAFEKLTSLTVESLLRKFNSASLTEAGMFEDTLIISQTQDYFLSENGITIQFDPYEIAPYYIGEIEADIGKQEILEILKPELINIFQKN